MNNKQLNLIMGGDKSNSGPREENDFYATNPQAIFNAQNMFMCILKDKVVLKIINPKFMVGVVHGAIVGLFLKKDIKEKQSYVGYRRN